MCEVVAKDPKRLAAHGSVLALFMFLAEMRVPARGGEVGGGRPRWEVGEWPLARLPPAGIVIEAVELRVSDFRGSNGHWP